MDKEVFESKIIDVIHYCEDIFELKIKSPLAAKNYKPGQFFKLQNFHNDSEKSFEPIAITASEIDGDIISSVIQIVGVSTKIASSFKNNELVSLMGPCGKPSYLPRNSTFLLIGGGVGIYALLPYAKALKILGNNVTILCGYRKKRHCILLEKIKQSVDSAIFSCDEGKIFESDNQNIHGSIIDSLKSLDLEGIRNLFVVGSSSMMLAVAEYVESYTKINKIASINAPMQCMLGGVCGQCLTLVPAVDGDKLVFICKNQEQILDTKLMQTLKRKLSQNSLLEKFF